MTILAGFKCIDGIVVCADTQETINHSKKSVTKLRVETPPHWKGYNGEIYEGDLAVAFCGAGWGPMIDKVIETTWQKVKPSSSLAEACALAEEAIKDTYIHFAGIYQTGTYPEIELIYGIKMEGESRLFTADGPVVNQRDSWVSAGCGGYMADYLASKMYGGHLTTRQCVILAAYILYEAKEHVDGCGGDSHIAVLRETESSGKVDWNLVRHVTEVASSLGNDFGNLLLSASDIDIPDEKFQASCSVTLGLVEAIRSQHREELQNSRDFNASIFGRLGSTDDTLGLPIEPDRYTVNSSEDS